MRLLAPGLVLFVLLAACAPEGALRVPKTPTLAAEDARLLGASAVSATIPAPRVEPDIAHASALDDAGSAPALEPHPAPASAPDGRGSTPAVEPYIAPTDPAAPPSPTPTITEQDATGSADPASPVQPQPLPRMGWVEPTRAERDTLPLCSEGMLTQPFIDLDQISSIIPLGSINPPGHIIPTEHLYINTAWQANGAGTIPIAAPGDIWITHISGGSGSSQSWSDYAVHFAICQDVFGYFGHIFDASPFLLAIIEESGCPTGARAGTRECSVKVMVPRVAGAALGTVRITGNFDLGLWDMRRLRSIANLDRFAGRSRYIQCPLEYFEGALKSQLFDLLARDDDNPCGTVSYDIVGTLQGNWFLEGLASIGNESIFFGKDNLAPGRGVVSIGGVLTTPGVMQLTQRTSGTTNRRFDQVTMDGQVYCYERDGTGRSEQYTQPSNLLPGRLLVQMISASQVRLEYQDGDCGPDAQLENPKTYVR